MRLYYRVLRLVCQVVYVLAMQGRVFGGKHVPRTGGVVLICNHQSFFDPMLAGLGLPRECHYMARDTLFRHRLFGRLIVSLNAFPVKRGTGDIGALKESLRRLKNEQLVVAFPEATRTRDGSIGAFHPGVVLMARRAGVPIIPAVIHGAYEIWPRDRRWPSLGRVRVYYGKGLSAREIQEWEPDRIIAHLRAQMISMYAQASRRAERT